MYSVDRLESEHTVEEQEEEDITREEGVLERWASCIYFASNKCVLFLCYIIIYEILLYQFFVVTKVMKIKIKIKNMVIYI